MNPIDGRDVHRAYVTSYPYLQPNWKELPDYSQQGYENVARELSKALDDDVVTIKAVRCIRCQEMLEAEQVSSHKCWLEGA